MLEKFITDNILLPFTIIYICPLLQKVLSFSAAIQFVCSNIQEFCTFRKDAEDVLYFDPKRLIHRVFPKVSKILFFINRGNMI